MKLQGFAALKALIPVALIGFGGLAWATGGSEAAAGTAQAWIDSPMAGAALDVSVLRVSTHVTADTPITSVGLEVDDKIEVSATPISTDDKLGYATFEWEATPGTHSIRVRGNSGDGWGPFSDYRTVVIGPAPEPGTPSSIPVETTTTLPVAEPTAPVETSSTLVTTTTTSTVPVTVPAPKPSVPAPAPKPVPAPAPVPAPVPTQPAPVTAPAPTAPPTTAAAPIIDSAVLSGNPILYRPNCAYSAVVTARIRNASSARVTIDDIGFDGPMVKSGEDFTITIPSGFASTSIGVKTVRVIATGPGGTVQASAGTIEIRFNCPKD